MELPRAQYSHEFREQSLKLPPAKPDDLLDHYNIRISHS